MSKSRVETPATSTADAREAERTSTHVRRWKLRVEVGEVTSARAHSDRTWEADERQAGDRGARAR